MGLFPKIESPCPYKDRLDELMQGEMCSMCNKNVFDLTQMDETGRREFMSECSGEVCVSYRLPIRKIVSGAAIIAASAPGLAAAQDASSEAPTNEDLYCYSDEIIVGGIREAGEALWIDLEAEKHLTDIPKVSDIADKKEDALLLFALHGTDPVEPDTSETVTKTAQLKEDATKRNKQ